jgi:hypothetical protein
VGGFHFSRLKDNNYKLYSTLAESIRLNWNFEEFQKIKIDPMMAMPEDFAPSGYGYAF